MPRYDPLCSLCHARPKMDRCGVCEECWYAPRHSVECEDHAQRERVIRPGTITPCICGAEPGRRED